MPKKLSTNPKAQEAREREQEKKNKARADKQERVEAEKWKESDPRVLKQLEKQKEQEQKRLLELQKREEKKRLQEEDEKQFAPRGEGKQDKTVKKSFAELKRIQQENLLRTLSQQAGGEGDDEERKQEEYEEMAAQGANQKGSGGEGNSDGGEDDDDLNDFTKTLEATLNQLMQESGSDNADASAKVVAASGVSDALNQLEDDKAIKHPEKKVKAAYMRYVDDQLPILKRENPTLKRSQLLQMIHKNWQKAPENPFNQRLVAYNEKQ